MTDREVKCLENEFSPLLAHFSSDLVTVELKQDPKGVMDAVSEMVVSGPSFTVDLKGINAGKTTVTMEASSEDGAKIK